MKAWDSSRASTRPLAVRSSTASGTADPGHVHADLVELDAGVGLRRVAHPLADRVGHGGDVHAVRHDDVDVDVGDVGLLVPGDDDALVDLTRPEDAPDALPEAGRRHAHHARHLVRREAHDLRQRPVGHEHAVDLGRPAPLLVGAVALTPGPAGHPRGATDALRPPLAALHAVV